MSTSTNFIANVPEARKFRTAKWLSDYTPAMYGIMLLLTSFLNRLMSFEMYIGFVIGTGLVMLVIVYFFSRRVHSLKPVINLKFAEEFESHSGIEFLKNFPITATPHLIPLTSEDGTETQWSVTKHADGFSVSRQNAAPSD